jgi:hypothetical protein
VRRTVWITTPFGDDPPEVLLVEGRLQVLYQPREGEFEGFVEFRVVGSLVRR